VVPILLAIHRIKFKRGPSTCPRSSDHLPGKKCKLTCLSTGFLVVTNELVMVVSGRLPLSGYVGFEFCVRLMDVLWFCDSTNKN
jgi:hypothetical protein